MTLNIISIAKDFSLFPGGRLKVSSKCSGEEFREKVLTPALIAGVPFVVDLDGVKGYPPSFLEEAFGGLMRNGFTLDQVRSLMTVKSEKQAWVDEVNFCMENANRLQMT